MKYGFEGYGLYNYCCEIIAGALSTDNITFELEHDSELLAHKGKMDSKKVEEIINYCIAQELFEMNDSMKVTWFKLIRLLDISTSNNPEFKKLLENISNYQNLLESNNESESITGNENKKDYYKLLESNSRREENTREENTREENTREENTREEKKKEVITEPLKFISKDFELLWVDWSDYKKKEHKEKYDNSKYEQIAINKLMELSDGNIDTARRIVKESIENRWKGLFPVKNGVPLKSNSERAKEIAEHRMQRNNIYSAKVVK